MAKICENPKCELHITIAAHLEKDLSVKILKNNVVTVINRHPYIHRDKNEFFLCDVCHEAVRLVNRPSTFY